MKKFSMLIVSIFFVLAIFSFVSCKGASTPDTEIIPNTDTGIVPDEENQTPSLENKEMGFNVVLPGKNISRAVYYTEDDASYYTVVLKKEETVICSKNGNPGETLKFTVTEEGDYNFSVSAYDNKDSLIAEGVVSKKITVTDGYVLVKVTLNPKLKELDVNIDIEIDWNEDDINYASEGIRIGEKLFSKTNEIYVISKESGNKTIIGKNLSGPFIESRKVVLSPYVMGQYEVTQELFEAIMGVNPSVNKSTSETENINLRPVDSANWYQVIAFCNKLSLIQNLEPVYSVEGITDWEQLPFDSIPTSSNAYWDSVVIDLSKNGYRLPTEAEWEYAARGGSIESSYWDTNFAGSNNYDSVAWVNENSNSVSHEVGLKDANSLGFYDMSGNVWEWCWEPHELHSYQRSDRGGCWSNNEDGCTISGKGTYHAYEQSEYIGFRIIRSVK